MDFLTDFISNQATLLIGLVVVLAFIIKLIISRLSKDTNTAIATNEIVDTVADKVIEEIKDIKSENDLKNPNIKEGFQVIEKPNDIEIEIDVEKMMKPTVVCEDGNIRDTEGNIVGRVKRKAGRPRKDVSKWKNTYGL